MSAHVIKDTFTTCGESVDVLVDEATLDIYSSPGYVRSVCLPGDRTFGTLIEEFCQTGTDNLIRLVTNDVFPFAVITIITPGHASCPIPNCDEEIVDHTVVHETVVGANDGQIAIAATNHIGEARSYSIDGGVTWHPNYLFPGLAPGSYALRVQYGDVCVKNGATVVVNEGTCDLVAHAVVPTDVTVFGGSDGELDFNIEFGTGPFLYSQDNGVTTQGTTPITGLTAGVYFWQVEDDDGCTVTGTAEITEPPPTVGGAFDPDLTISDLIPYEFQINLAAGGVSKVLYNALEIPGITGVCHHAVLGCTDNLTFQFKYLDLVTFTTPRIRIRRWSDDTLLATLTTFNDTTDGYYSIQTSATPYCGEIIYLEIISWDGSVEHFVHATSGSIRVGEPYFDSVHIVYSDDQDYTDIKYKETGYFNEIRIQGNFYEQTNPQTDSMHELSDGQQVKLKSTLKRAKKLNVFKLPDYLHEKVQGALGHDNITIESVLWIKDGDYEKDDFNFRERERNARVMLLNKNSFYQENTL